MNPLILAQAIVGHLTAKANGHERLSEMVGNIYIQRLPPNLNLPYLQLVLQQSKSQSYANKPSDTEGLMQFSLVCSLSTGAEQLAIMHDALVDLLDQKQIILQDQSQQRLLHCWLQQIKDIDIEHDRIKLTSDWQLRCV